MSNDKKFYVTTPIYYVNSVPHIGHTYTTVAADALARYHRMLGEDSFMLTGTDEHGAKIAEKADEAKKKPIDFVDEIAAKFQMTWDRLNISNDNFIRTTNPSHMKTVQRALEFMKDKGDIELGSYEGLYCMGCEQFKAERDLVDGKCSDHQTKPKVMKEESYMFKMSKYTSELAKKIESDEIKISPQERKNELLSFYKDGLTDVSFSRKNVEWGIPVSWDNSHTIYVWADAFLNYLTGLGWNGEGGKSPEMFPPELQLMSKDILRVHGTIWLAMLLSLELPLPKEIFVHGYFKAEGQKMSKTIGNVISPDDLIDKYGSDATRFLIIGATTFGRDGDIGYEIFDKKFNSELANGIGNLVGRVISLTEKYYDGKVPQKCDELVMRSDNTSLTKFHYRAEQSWGDYKSRMEKIEIDLALNSIMEIVRDCDKHITSVELWKFVKEEKDEGAKHIYSLLEMIRQISLRLWPFMPRTADEIWKRIGLDYTETLSHKFGEMTKWGLLKPGLKVQSGKPLIPRISIQ